MMRRVIAFLPVVVLGIAATVPVRTPDDPTPGDPLATEQVREDLDVVYGTGGGMPLVLDLYAPREPRGPTPALVFIHPGGWYFGWKEDMRQVARAFAQWGYVTVAVDYRLAPQAKFPAQIEDVKCAVRWLRAHAGQYGIDPRRVAAVGVSAGAHLALLLGLTEPADGLEGQGGHPEQSSRVQAVVSLMGPTDLSRPCLSLVADALVAHRAGATREEMLDAYRRASPITYVRKGAPPVLALHGTADAVVPFAQAYRLHAALKGVGATTYLVPMEDRNHDWTWTSGDCVHMVGLTLAFLHTHLGRPPGAPDLHH
jgi:acetyl esterase/lipase